MSAYFDRFDICEAHYALEMDYNVGGWLRERPSNRRRMEATHVQLKRIGFKPGTMFSGFRSLSENGREIYRELERRYRLVTQPGQCECTDPGCPCEGECKRDSSMTLFRIDMEDENGTAFCESCAEDALDSGVFSTRDEEGEVTP